MEEPSPGGGAQGAGSEDQTGVLTDSADDVVDGAHRQTPVRGTHGDEQGPHHGAATEELTAVGKPRDQRGRR
jgi:hypothetical protein